MSEENTKSDNSLLEEIISFTYPKLHAGKDWYVGFYAFDPAKKKMRRKRIKINFIKKNGARRRYADGLMRRLVVQLEKGWNPWNGYASWYQSSC